MLTYFGSRGEQPPGRASRAADSFEPHEAPTLTRRVPAPDENSLVLVVEDEEDTRSLYVECLTHLGYRSLGAASGEEGIALALRARPDAIIMDVAMPGLGGIEATRRIKADPRTRACRVVVVTAHGGAMFAEARRAGCDAYFCKPFNVFALDSVLRVLGSVHARPTRVAPTAIVKRCACGREYTFGAWLGLRLMGRMHARNGGAVELRNCLCGSSIVLPVEDAPPVPRAFDERR